jgi:hypothetical protein
MVEDPACGSLNAGLAHCPPSARCGSPTTCARAPPAAVRVAYEAIWTAGATRTVIDGTLDRHRNPVEAGGG